ncbi:hypothetical protein PHLGIDRAFT_113827 [Phlebiopsis gigantea 11061_1 CR5-6]|uniref:Uncharacterized protein n=1 Tax=Phlebiopsis gigantea (strain 11061_1 CR5-6) TaxID=745531 RepID=A0A0C3SE28_PHLG1|nr:hypothetical protein PHLGIDRAFT_113827 [Phlebiopsis gigantea 11061_1 CR5-6]
MTEIHLSSPSSLSPMKTSRARTAPTGIGLAQERENLIWDLDETVPEIDRSFFETHLLPPSPLPPGVTAESIVANLIASGHAKEDHEIHAYALRNPVESSVTTSLRWVDVAVPAEFKKANHPLMYATP